MRKLVYLAVLALTIVMLWIVMALLRDVDFGASTSVFQPKSLAATGFIILAAFAMGEAFKLLKMPALLGYIAAGIVFGPNFLSALEAWHFVQGAPDALFSREVISDLTLVNVLTVGVIGTMGGGELVLEDISRNLKTIVLVVALFFVLAVPATAVTILWIARDAPDVIPFLAGLPIEHHYAAALLFGVFAVAMSPAATLAILQETRARGRFASLALGVVIVADLVLVASFLLAFSFDQILLAPDGFSMDALVAELPRIGGEFAYALALGIATGIVFIVYLRFVKREELFFTVAIIFLASFLSKLLHAETLLAFLTAGFVVQNFSRHGHDMIGALEKISLPVFVIYFMTQAAKLDLEAVLGFALITFILTLVRGLTLYVATTLGADLARADGTSRRYLWLAFFSRGGVDLVLAATVAGSSLPWGTEFQTVIMACVVVHIVVGPPMLKLALDWAGETEGSRQRTADEAHAFAQLSVAEVDSTAERFVVGRFEDPELADRVAELRTLLVGLHRDYIAVPIEAKHDTMTDSLAEACDELATALQQLEEIIASDAYESPAARAEAVADVHVTYLHDIADNVATWEAINPEIVHQDRIAELVDAVRNREDFASTYRVDREQFLFEPDPQDNVLRRLGKGLRRLRRAVFGPGARHVPLGRLWRYYVELSVTRYLARAADATSLLNERFWADLGNHMRRVDDLFDELYDAVLDEKPPAPVVVTDSEPPDDDEQLPPSPPADPPVSAAARILAEGRDAIEEREARIVAQLETLTRTAIERYTISLRETFSSFAAAAELAGTYELPQWRYRPSTLFDSARRAEAQIHARLRREHTIVTGQRGWIVAEWQLILFLYWLPEYEQTIRSTMRALVANPVGGQIDVLGALCEALPIGLDAGEWKSGTDLRAAVEQPDAADRSWPSVDWERWLTEEVRPTIDRARTNLQRMVGLYGKGHVSRRLLEPLERRVGAFSEEIVLLSEHPDELDANRAVPTLTIPLREWFVSEIVRESALRLVELDERGETILRACISSLEDVQQVVEFNLLTAHRDVADADNFHALDVATGGLERAARMLEEMQDGHERRFDQLTSWIVDETNQIADRATEPFLQHRHAEIERLMTRRGQTSLAERGESWVANVIDSIASVGRAAYRRYRPLAEEVVEEVQSLFVETIDPIRNSDIRERLRPNKRLAVSIPPIYRRLFTPVPLDIPDFYVDRIDVESPCCRAVTDWNEGANVTVLVYGDRGVGKRSTIQHLLQHAPELAPLRSACEIHSVVLDDDLQSEAEIVQRIGAVLPNEPANTMEGLVRFIEVLDSRHVVVVEHGEKLFNRTEQGLAVARRFLRAMNETSGNVLWIVLMGTPAVTYLETAIGVLDYFTHAFEIAPLDEAQISLMIQKRHRVSGFQASFDRQRPRVRDWIREPLRTSESIRDPRAEYFRSLAHLSRGNPMLALIYWLESCRLDDGDDQLIRLGTLPAHEPEVVAPLSLTKRLILAALVQHHTLTPMQLRSILRREFDEVQTELDHLERLGFVRQIVGRQVTAYSLRDLADGLVTTSLRDMNMI